MNDDLVKKMNETLGLVPEVLDGNDIEEIKDEQLVKHESDKIVVGEKVDAHLSEDYDESREIYKNLAKTGQEALIEAVKIASLLDNPKAFESVAQLMKVNIEVAEALMKLQKDVRYIAQEESKNNGGEKKVITNNVFFGSTAELQKKLKELEENN